MSMLKKNSFFYKALILAFFGLIFSILLKHSFDYLDPDLGWHLKFGRDIAETGNVPRVNLVNYTIFRADWVDHEWLSNLISFFVFDNLSYLGLNLFFALLALAAFALQYLIAKRFFVNKGALSIFIFLSIQLLAVIASLPSLGIRMQEFTLLFLAIELFILYSYERAGKASALLILPPLIYFWSCLHGGFLLGLGVLSLYLAANMAQALVVRGRVALFLEKRLLPKGWGIHLSLCLVACLAATLVTPYGLELYSFLTSYKNDFYLGRIFEWFHQFRYPFFYTQLFYLEAAFLVAGWWFLDVLLLRRESKFKLGLWEAVILLVFMIMAIKSRRHLPLFAMFSAPILSALLAEFSALKDRSLPERLSGDRRIDMGLKVFLASIFLVSSLFILVSGKFNNDPWRYYRYKYPYAAVNFLKADERLSQERIFNEFNWGGYMIWVWPGKELFIDGRLPQMEYKGHSLLEEFYDFFEEGKSKDKLEEYDIGVVLLSAKSGELKPARWERLLLGVKELSLDRVSPLENYLASSSEWSLVYDDEVAKVFARE